MNISNNVTEELSFLFLVRILIKNPPQRFLTINKLPASLGNQGCQKKESLDKDFGIMVFIRLLEQNPT